MPNLLAYAAIIFWPFVSLALFAIFPARIACLTTIMAGDMFLPAAFEIDLPLIPPIGKDNISTFAALVGCFALRRNALSVRDSGGKYNWLFVSMILGSLMTTLTNGDPIHYGAKFIQGQTAHDFISDVINAMIGWWPAFYLGRKLFCRPEDIRLLLKAFAVSGVIYSFFIFIEVRLSPQLNLWVYGYHQSDFLQTIRFGGYRPKVFMRHGLNVGLFMAMTVVAAAGLQRARIRTFGIGAAAIGAYLTFTLLICKSSGATVYALVVVPFILWMRIRSQTRLSVCLAMGAFSYPLLRAADLVPIEGMLSFFDSVLGADRTQSMSFRFSNEAVLLEHAMKRIWFGWGGYGRNLLFDPITGVQSTIVDGFWIALLGGSGVVGFVSVFGLIVFPIVRFGRKLRTFQMEDQYCAGALLCTAVICVVDLIPNAGVCPYVILILGSLAGLNRQDPAEETLYVANEEHSQEAVV
jgi:hypothetical protein